MNFKEKCCGLLGAPFKSYDYLTHNQILPKSLCRDAAELVQLLPYPVMDFQLLESPWFQTDVPKLGHCDTPAGMLCLCSLKGQGNGESSNLIVKIAPLPVAKAFCFTYPQQLWHSGESGEPANPLQIPGLICPIPSTGVSLLAAANAILPVLVA